MKKSLILLMVLAVAGTALAQNEQVMVTVTVVPYIEFHSIDPDPVLVTITGPTLWQGTGTLNYSVNTNHENLITLTPVAAVEHADKFSFNVFPLTQPVPVGGGNYSADVTVNVIADDPWTVPSGTYHDAGEVYLDFN